MKHRVMWGSIIVLLTIVLLNIIFTSPHYSVISANRNILHQFAGEIALASMEKKKVPIRMAEVYEGNDLPVDYWGEPIWYEIAEGNDGEFIWAFSAGQDRVRGTEDDMVVKYNFDLTYAREAIREGLSE